MNRTLIIASALSLALAACSAPKTETEAEYDTVSSLPAEHFDLSHWNITVPTDVDNNKKVDTVSVADIQSYSHPDFFYACLLYTSPSPRDLSTSRMPSSA